MNSIRTDIYLDSNATTRVLPQAAQSAFEAMEDLFGNPSSSHTTGLRARYILESTRQLIRTAIGAEQGKIIFTSGATEAIQTAVFSVLSQRGGPRNLPSSPRLLLYGATEHKAVPQALKHWNQVLGSPHEIVAIPVDAEGRLDLEFLEAHVDQAAMVCTMAVNNETGVITDLKAVEAILRRVPHHVPWLVDSVQAVGKISLDLSDTSIDYASFSGHKIYAPKGIGVLYVRQQAPLVPLLAGGGQESGARGGTENLPGVAALGAVFQCLNDPHSPVFQDTETLKRHRDKLVEALQIAFPAIVFNAPFESSVPTTLNFSVPGFSSKEILDLFDAASIRVSSGSACGSAIQGSFVLEAMGLEQWRSDSAIRMSFSTCTTEDEIKTACDRIVEAGNALCDSCLAISNSVGASARHPVNGLVQLKHENQCSWILLDQSSRSCIVVDPVEALAERIELLIRCQDCRVLAVLDTHSHPSIPGCREMLVRLLADSMADPNCPTDPLGWPGEADGTVTLGDGSQAPYIRLQQQRVAARVELPGHTADSVGYIIGTITEDNHLPSAKVEFALTGDLIQIGGLGRSDIATGDPQAFLDSLRRLAVVVDPQTVLCPSHDYHQGFCTTLAAEQTPHSLLFDALRTDTPLASAEFVQAKSQLDAQIENSVNAEWRCGLIKNPGGRSFVDIPPEQLPDFFASHADAIIIDVREPHEHRLTDDWLHLGLSEQPENVPLTRFTNFIQGLLQRSDLEDHRPIICLCRSGNRSGKAAEVLKRIGIEQVWHVAGGLALGTPADAAQVREADIEFLI
jgi:cysteine desulfurase